MISGNPFTVSDPIMADSGFLVFPSFFVVAKALVVVAIAVAETGVFFVRVRERRKVSVNAEFKAPRIGRANAPV